MFHFMFCVYISMFSYVTSDLCYLCIFGFSEDKCRDEEILSELRLSFADRDHRFIFRVFFYPLLTPFSLQLQFEKLNSM